MSESRNDTLEAPPANEPPANPQEEESPINDPLGASGQHWSDTIQAQHLQNQQQRYQNVVQRRMNASPTPGSTVSFGRQDMPPGTPRRTASLAPGAYSGAAVTLASSSASSTAGDVELPHVAQPRNAYAVPAGRSLPDDAAAGPSATPHHQQGRLQMPSQKHILAALTDAEIMAVSNKMFFPGFFFLPWLHITHNWYLWPVKNWRSRSLIHRQLVRRFWIAGACAAVYIGLFIAWVCVYATQWVSWGLWGVRISMVVPYGQ